MLRCRILKPQNRRPMKFNQLSSQSTKIRQPVMQYRSLKPPNNRQYSNQTTNNKMFKCKKRMQNNQTLINKILLIQKSMKYHKLIDRYPKSNFHHLVTPIINNYNQIRSNLMQNKWNKHKMSLRLNSRLIIRTIKHLMQLMAQIKQNKNLLSIKMSQIVGRISNSLNLQSNSSKKTLLHKKIILKSKSKIKTLIWQMINNKISNSPLNPCN